MVNSFGLLFTQQLALHLTMIIFFLTLTDQYPAYFWVIGGTVLYVHDMVNVLYSQ
jgi:hypothetical protein